MLNLFVFPDVFSLAALVEISPVSADALAWSFTGGFGRILLNGVGANAGDIINPAAGVRVDQSDLDPARVDAVADTVTFRNAHLSPIGGSNVDPVLAGVLPGETVVLTLNASTGDAAGSTSFITYTANSRVDDLMNGDYQFETEDDFLVNGPSGWIGGVTQGGGSTGVVGGLCMVAPAAGDNIIGWVSPERYVPLTDQTVYRFRVAATTDQQTENAIPLWNFAYDNYNTGGAGNTYGGEVWVLDVNGGSQGIGRPQGRTDFVFFGSPNAMDTPQWRGLIDAANSAFTPQADAVNDMRVIFRLLDLDSSGIAAGADSGAVCVTRIRVDSVLRDAFGVASIEFNPVISSRTHAAQSLSEAAENAGAAVIDDVSHAANYQLLDGSGLGFRKDLLPYDQTLVDASNNRRLYPVAWTANGIYRTSIKIQSNVQGAEGTDPADVIFIAMDSALSELGGIHFSTRGSAPDNMLRAASPRLPTTTGGQPQSYTAYFDAMNEILDTFFTDSHRLRPLAYFMNRTDIAPEGSGADPFSVLGMKVEKLLPPVE